MKRLAIVALLSLVSAPVLAQGVCVGNPPLRIEKGSYRVRGFELTSEEFDLWLSQVRAMCQAQPWAVNRGGTGVASLTAYAPIFGGTTSTGAVQSGTVGTAGQVLTSNGAGALPTFQNAAGGGSTPGGSGTELQYRAGASTLGAVTDSSVSGANIALKGELQVDPNGDASPELAVLTTSVDMVVGGSGAGTFHLDASESRFQNGTSLISLDTAGEAVVKGGAAELVVTDPAGLTFNGVNVVTTATDDDTPEAGEFGALALTGDVTSSGLATTIGANSVALGTDTTGGYAASASEGGSATSVAANSVALTTDTTGNYAAGDGEAGAALTGDSATSFFATGTIEPARLGSGSGGSTKFLREDSTWQTVSSGSGDFVGPSSSTDNAIVRFDGTTGKLGQDSGLTVADVSGSSVAVATTAGNALAISATAPAAAGGASQAGKAASLTASAAVASTDTAGAAAGGSVTITAGAAARLTSGNAKGGDIILTGGTGIGTGDAGQILSTRDGSSTAPAYSFTGDTDTGLIRHGSGRLGVMNNGTYGFEFQASGDFGPALGTNGAPILRIAGDGSLPQYTFHADTDTGFAHTAADTAAIYAGGSARVTVTTSHTAVDALRYIPRSSPPVTCGNANTEGVTYSDSDGSKALCWCDGTAWQVAAGSGTCS